MEMITGPASEDSVRRAWHTVSARCVLTAIVLYLVTCGGRVTVASFPLDFTVPEGREPDVSPLLFPLVE